MPRRFESGDADFSNLQLETVFDGYVRESCTGLRSNVDARAGSRRQFSVSGNKVSMQMSLEDVANGNLILLGGLQINFDVTLRIDHDGLTLRGEHVGCVRQTAQIELFEVHGSPLGLEVRPILSRKRESRQVAGFGVVSHFCWFTTNWLRQKLRRWARRRAGL